MSPRELSLEITPRARVDVTDVRARAAEIHGDVLDGYARALYCSLHTTAGYLPQSLASRLCDSQAGVEPYIDVFRAMFPEGAGYRHDDLDDRTDLTPVQRPSEPLNGDSHLAFIAGGLHACVSYSSERSGPVNFIDLDGVVGNTPRRRTTRIVGYNHEVEVAQTTVQIPVSLHPIDAINLREERLGLLPQLMKVIETHRVTKGRIRLTLAPTEHYASLTVNEYETLLMRHDLAEVLKNPLRFAAEQARHVWSDPRTVPAKAIDYAKYDFVRTLNELVDALGLGASRIERLLAKALAVPASRFLRMKRSIDLLVSDSASPGEGQLVEGTYQAPILVQWRGAPSRERSLEVSLTRFL